jgi:hypothetical protein
VDALPLCGGERFAILPFILQRKFWSVNVIRKYLNFYVLSWDLLPELFYLLGYNAIVFGWVLNGLHGLVSQEIGFIITTAVRATNPIAVCIT